MEDGNEWEPVALAVLEELDDVIDRRLAAFRDLLDQWLRDILGGPIPNNLRDLLAQFVERTADLGLAITPDSIGVIARIVESRMTSTDEPASQNPGRRVRSRMVDGAFVQSVIPSASGPPARSAGRSGQSVHYNRINMADYTAATQRIITILGAKWNRVSSSTMSRVRDVGAVVDEHTGAAIGLGSNALGVEAFVRLTRKDGGFDTAHFVFVSPPSGTSYWELVGIQRGQTPEQGAAVVAAREKIRHADVIRVRNAMTRFEGGMFAVVGGIGGIFEGAPLLGTLEVLSGAEQVALSGADLATGEEHRAWSARGIQAALETAGLDAETAQFLADHGGLLIALSRATVDAAGTAHAVIETSTGYRIRLEFDPATLSANGLGGAKIKVTKLVPAAGKGVSAANTSSGRKANASINSRPSPRQSEVDIGAELEEKGYSPQQSFKKRKEVPYSTKGSSRPDHSSGDVSIEVKNYNLGTSEGRRALVRKVVEQAKQRAVNLPKEMRQEIQIDIRGQKVPREVMQEIVADIVKGSNGAIKIKGITFRSSRTTP